MREIAPRKFCGRRWWHAKLFLVYRIDKRDIVTAVTCVWNCSDSAINTRCVWNCTLEILSEDTKSFNIDMFRWYITENKSSNYIYIGTKDITNRIKLRYIHLESAVSLPSCLVNQTTSRFFRIQHGLCNIFICLLFGSGHSFQG